MTKEEFSTYVSVNYGVTPDNPFKDVDALVFRHKNNKKWFALIMQVSNDKIMKLNKDEKVRNIDILDLKTDPLLRGDILKKKGVYVAYHMNKVHWITLNLEEVEREDLEFLLDLSFNLTK